MKNVRPVIASNEVPYLQMRSVGSHSRSGRENKGKKEGKACDNGFLSSKLLKIRIIRESYPLSNGYLQNLGIEFISSGC